MTEAPFDISHLYPPGTDMMQTFMQERQQGMSALVGPSSSGKCYRALAYRYHGTPPTEERSKAKADLGTLIHLGWSAMIRQQYPDGSREPDVRLTWPELPRAGEADDVHWAELIVTDAKTANARAWQAMVDRGEPYLNYWDQLEMYALALHRQHGGQWTMRIALINTETGEVENFLRDADPDRGRELVLAMADRHKALSLSVVRDGSPEDFPQEGKGPGRGFPCDWCEWVSRCWPAPFDVNLTAQSQTIVDDPDAVADMARQYREGMAMEKEGQRLKYDAAAFLAGIEGTFGGYVVSRTKDGQGQNVLDEDAARAALIEAGLPVPELWKPGRRGYVTVRAPKR